MHLIIMNQLIADGKEVHNNETTNTETTNNTTETTIVILPPADCKKEITNRTYDRRAFSSTITTTTTDRCTNKETVDVNVIPSPLTTGLILISFMAVIVAVVISRKRFNGR